MTECTALKPSDTEGNVRRDTKSVISPESDRSDAQWPVSGELEHLSGTKMWEEAAEMIL